MTCKYQVMTFKKRLVINILGIEFLQIKNFNAGDNIEYLAHIL